MYLSVCAGQWGFQAEFHVLKGTETLNGRTRKLTISSLVLMEYEMSGGRKWARQKQGAYMLR